MKKITSFILLGSLLLLNSCAEKEKIKNTPEEKQKPITFVLYSADQESELTFTDSIAQIITEKTGVTLQIQGPVDDVTQDIQLMIANHNFPDLIYAKSDISKLIDSRCVIPLDEYIEKYGKNVKQLYGDQLNRLRNTLSDPQIYTFGTYPIKDQAIEISGNIQLQNAVLREFGYPQIKTLNDLENILKAYKAKYPEIEGKKTVGMSILTDSWHWLLGLSNPGNFVIGYPDDGEWIIDQETFSAQYKFLNPQMDTYYRWLNKIYHEGLLDPESFTQSPEAYRAKLATGTVLCTTYPHWGLEDVHRSLVAEDRVERTFAFLPITAAEKYKDPSLKDYGFSGGWGIAISVTCKDPLRAFMFMDFMCSEEAQILTNWGVKGVDYFYDSTGKRFSATIPKSTGIVTWTYPFPEAGPGYIDSTGNPIGRSSKDVVIRRYNSAQRETLKAYGAECWPDLFPSSEELGVSKHGQLWKYTLSAKNQEILDNCDAYVKQELIKMIVGPEQKFDSSWTNMQETIKSMGISKVEKELTSLIEVKRALWNY